MRALPALLLLLTASPAFGQGLPLPEDAVVMRLQYTRAPGAEACPDADLFSSILRGRVMRWNPLAPDAPHLLTVLFSRRDRGYESFAELRDDTGAVRFTRTFSPVPRCMDAAEDLAMGIAIAIERPAVRKPPLACHTAPLPSASSPLPPPPPCMESRYAVWPERLPMSPKPDPPTTPERWPLAIRVGLTAWPEVMVSGWGSLGLSLDAGVRYRSFSASVEVHGDPPLDSEPYWNKGDVSVARVSGALLLCGHWGWFAGCAVGDAGRIFFLNPKLHDASALYGAVGVRAGLEFPVAPPRFFLRAAVDLRAPIHPASATLQGAASSLTSAGLGFGLGLGLLVELPP